MKVKSFKNQNQLRHSKVTCLKFINTHDKALLLSGTGEVKGQVVVRYVNEINGVVSPVFLNKKK